jgi:RNA polymerase subunit RPABC4/transcription elongation factor Spt4
MSNKKDDLAGLVDRIQNLLVGWRVCAKCGKVTKHRNPISCAYCNSEMPKAEHKPEPKPHYVAPKQCPKCGRSYIEEELFCPYCREKLVEIRFQVKGSGA